VGEDDDMTDTCATLWDEFLASGSAGAAAARGAKYTSWQFGLGSEMADSLLALVLDGGQARDSGIAARLRDRARTRAGRR
jgi:uncharacterized protein YhfF